MKHRPPKKTLINASVEAIDRLQSLENEYTKLLGRVLAPARKNQLLRDRNEISAIKKALAAALEAGGKAEVLRKLLGAGATAITLSAATVAGLANLDGASQEVSEIVETIEDIARDSLPIFFEPEELEHEELGMAPVRPITWTTSKSTEDLSRQIFGSRYRLAVGGAIADAKTAGDLVSIRSITPLVDVPPSSLRSEFDRLVDLGLLQESARQGKRKLYLPTESPYWPLMRQLEAESAE